MADSILRSKHAFGTTQGLSDAIASKKVDEYDILFLDGDTNPKIGWIDAKGNIRIVQENDEIVNVDSLPESGEIGKVYILDEDAYIWTGEKFANICKPTDVSALEEEIAKKADVEMVESQLNAMLDNFENVYSKCKYEFVDVPNGTIVDYRDNEIRIMCPSNVVFEKQSVGAGGDTNSYYGMLKTYAPCNEAIGYIEHLGNQVDKDILTDLKIDKYGRKYQPTWLALAKYDESTDSWTYFGKNSTKDNYIGWDYQIDWYDENGVMIASDSVRINLSNEDCHSFIEPYYVSNVISEVNAYTDSKIEEKLSEIAGVPVVEF